MSRWISSIFNRQRFAGNRRLFLLCLLLFVVSGCFSFWTFFPADVLQRRLLQDVSQQTGLQMEGRNAAMLFPLGLGLDLLISPRVPGLTDLELTELQITPAWSSLFSANKKIRLVATLAGGKIDAAVARSGQFSVEIAAIALDALQQQDLPYRVSGQLTGQLEGENISPEMTGRGHFSFSLKDVRILGLARIGLPADFFAGMLRLEGKLTQRRISLEKAILTGGALELSGGGNILIGETVEQSRLNLNIRLHPTATTPDSLRDLLNLTGVRPTVDGSYLLRVGGTISRPIVR
ncbi:MAG: type II secretion system protein GspN [Deltaproteobacteria bacterium]|nr:MAG: type II secretion system protein GspN [Deltaproteobacteria bacterium]